MFGIMHICAYVYDYACMCILLHAYIYEYIYICVLYNSIDIYMTNVKFNFSGEKNLILLM